MLRSAFITAQGIIMNQKREPMQIAGINTILTTLFVCLTEK